VVTLILRKKIWQDFDDQIFLCTLNYGCFSLSHFFNESNKSSCFKFKFSIRWITKVRIFFYNEFLMIICKMTYVIQSILPSHYLHNVNLNNYRFPYSLRLLHLLCAFTPKLTPHNVLSPPSTLCFTLHITMN
jgi:hypothetical protein